jgi:Mn-dependent DtxR family transcriptional regulator
MNLEKCSKIICLALNHPLRRWIIELLEARGTLDCSELRSLLNISSGRLSYHLENLVGLIEQDENRQYLLTMEGKRAYRLLIESNDSAVKILIQPTTLADD